jgi:uncharacterized peroxidase-related enzyme
MWIQHVPYERADADLKASYDRQARALGAPTEMTLAGSLHPPLVAARLDLYAATERCPSRVTPHQRNLVSFVTSALNATPHCMSQVTIKLRETGLTDDDIVHLGSDPLAFAAAADDGGSSAEAEVIRYTVKLTRQPGAVTEDDVERLRAVGFDDLDILDLNAQCAHLNYVNRVANGLGIHTVVDPDFPAYSAIPESR